MKTYGDSVSGQKKVRRTMRTEAGGVSHSDDLFRLYEMFKAGDTSVYEALREKLDAWHRSHNTPEAVMEGIMVSENQILNEDVLTAEEAAEETRRIFGWQK